LADVLLDAGRSGLEHRDALRSCFKRVVRHLATRASHVQCGGLSCRTLVSDPDGRALSEDGASCGVAKAPRARVQGGIGVRSSSVPEGHARGVFVHHQHGCLRRPRPYLVHRTERDLWQARPQLGRYEGVGRAQGAPAPMASPRRPRATSGSSRSPAIISPTSIWKAGRPPFMSRPPRSRRTPGVVGLQGPALGQ
jgi:hypothetical protein